MIFYSWKRMIKIKINPLKLYTVTYKKKNKKKNKIKRKNLIKIKKKKNPLKKWKLNKKN